MALPHQGGAHENRSDEEQAGATHHAPEQLGEEELGCHLHRSKKPKQQTCWWARNMEEEEEEEKEDERSAATPRWTMAKSRRFCQTASSKGSPHTVAPNQGNNKPALSETNERAKQCAWRRWFMSLPPASKGLFAHQ